MTLPHEPAGTDHAPRRVLSVASAVSIIVGIVIGAGIFKTPSMVAGFVPSVGWFIAAWVLGGVISIIGALCYAELAATYPDAGGDYHYITRAFGRDAAFLFAWARMTVIQTGSIAVHAFIIGDYASATFADFGPYSSAVYAAVVVVILTALNLAGVRQGARAQMLLSGCVLLALLMVVAVGAMALFRESGVAAATSAGPAAAAAATARPNMFGLAMVFVLLTYGGWNEAAYLSAEVRGRRGIVGALLGGMALVMGIYLLVNAAYLAAVGMDGMANTKVVAADMMETTFLGTNGARLISLIIVVAAVGNINGTIITGARTNYALGRDFPVLATLARWKDSSNTPINALVIQGIISMLLVGVGAFAKNGFSAMVEYTAPVFWLFFLLAGLSVIVLRQRERGIPRPFKTPLYPLTPILFCLACAYMLYSSLDYAGRYAWIGVAVLIAGLPMLLIARRQAALANVRGFPIDAAPEAVQQQA